MTEILVKIEEVHKHCGRGGFLIEDDTNHPGFWIYLPDDEPEPKLPQPKPKLSLVKEHEIIWF